MSTSLLMCVIQRCARGYLNCCLLLLGRLGLYLLQQFPQYCLLILHRRSFVSYAASYRVVPAPAEHLCEWIGHIPVSGLSALPQPHVSSEGPQAPL